MDEESYRQLMVQDNINLTYDYAAKYWENFNQVIEYGGYLVPRRTPAALQSSPEPDKQQEAGNKRLLKQRAKEKEHTPDDSAEECLGCFQN